MKNIINSNINSNISNVALRMNKVDIKYMVIKT